MSLFFFQKKNVYLFHEKLNYINQYRSIILYGNIIYCQYNILSTILSVVPSDEEWAFLLFTVPMGPILCFMLLIAASCSSQYNYLRVYLCPKEERYKNKYAPMDIRRREKRICHQIITKMRTTTTSKKALGILHKGAAVLKQTFLHYFIILS